MGGIWFAMPLVWSMFGIEIAGKLDKRPIDVANAIEDVANAIEARAMIGGIESSANDPRVLGSRKLAGIAVREPTYERLDRRNTYVTQPFRQACTQPLTMLGLLKPGASRFNAFELSADEERLLNVFWGACAETYEWVRGKVPSTTVSWPAG